MIVTEKVSAENLAFASGITDELWYPKNKVKAYQWWSFDALSDDGREALVINFYDNFVFSPRYNSPNPNAKFPAVAFYFYRNGKPIFRVINEFSEKDFQAEATCIKIHENQFKFDSAPYGKGLMVEINAVLSGNKRLTARLEWLFIESDFEANKTLPDNDLHFWNLVAPRSDVTGHIKVLDKKGKVRESIHFRGTGCHTSHSDRRFFTETIESLQWGRAHFADATAVFFRLREVGKEESTAKLFVIRNGELRNRDAEFKAQNFSRQLFGIKYPNRLRFASHDNMRLRVKQTDLLDSSLFNLRFLSEMTLTLRDGKPRKTLGITEHLAPKALKYRWLDWLTNLRINRKG
jgi:hypothetical protein